MPWRSIVVKDREGYYSLRRCYENSDGTIEFVSDGPAEPKCETLDDLKLYNSEASEAIRTRQLTERIEGQ